MLLKYIPPSQQTSERCRNDSRINQHSLPQQHVVLRPSSSQSGLHRNNIGQERNTVQTFRLYATTTTTTTATSFENHWIAATNVPTILDSSWSITMPTPTFEPVLNVPALTVFLFIMSIFAFLQWRIRAIDHAAGERNTALRQLRNLKARELSDPTMSSSTGSSTNINHQVQVALEEYQRAYDRMEELRTILPGVRIVSPPSSNINVKQQQEHEMAAQQFLGILPFKDDNEDDEVKQRTDRTILSNDKGINEKSPLSSMMIRNILLVFVAITQIALFLFLIGTDPMMQSSLSSNIHETTSIWP